MFFKESKEKSYPLEKLLEPEEVEIIYFDDTYRYSCIRFKDGMTYCFHGCRGKVGDIISVKKRYINGEFKGCIFQW